MRGSWNFAAPVFEPAAAFAVELAPAALPPLVQAVVDAVVRDAEIVRQPRRAPLCKTDAGRKAAGIGERADCTVRSPASTGRAPRAACCALWVSSTAPAPTARSRFPARTSRRCSAGSVVNAQRAK